MIFSKLPHGACFLDFGRSMMKRNDKALKTAGGKFSPASFGHQASKSIGLLVRRDEPEEVDCPFNSWNRFQ